MKVFQAQVLQVLQARADRQGQKEREANYADHMIKLTELGRRVWRGGVCTRQLDFTYLRASVCALHASAALLFVVLPMCYAITPCCYCILNLTMWHCC
jgi:hypothetical protein